MPVWDRTTPWRQGHVLPEQAISALQLKNHQFPEETVAVVISHDCDLAAASAKEPNVEIILGRTIDKPQGHFMHAKTARTLHIPFRYRDQERWVELEASQKQNVAKLVLADYPPHSQFLLERTSHSTLQRWLAARYRRSAFPDEFEKRLKKHKLDKQLESILEEFGAHVLAIFFDVDEGEEKTHSGDDDTYVLTIYLLYTAEPDPEKSHTSAEEARQRIEITFTKALFQPRQQWHDIELRECIVVSDAAMTIQQSLQLREWRLEHLSLADDPPQPML